MDERMDRLSAALDELIAERDEARALAEAFRNMLQAYGVLFEKERLPWEDK